MSDVSLVGGCRCGGVRYEITSEPTDVTHCHCSMCRRSASAPFLTWMQLPVSGVKFTAGPLREYHSSDQGTRSFCPTCGCQIQFLYLEDPDTVYITAATLDDPEAVSPRSHSYAVDALRWIHIDDELPQFETEEAQ